MSVLTLIEVISGGFILAFALLFAVAVVTTTVLRAIDKARREPKQDEPTWYTVWRQR